MVYFISRIIYKVLLKILCRFEVIGEENLPDKGPFIIASNHMSLVDPAVLGVACNTTPLMFMAKKELFNIPVLGLWCKAIGCIPAKRHSGNFQSLREVVRRLKSGEALGIFPEGTRSPNGELQKPEPGIGLIAAKSGAPIIPVYISGTNNVLPKGRKFITPHKVAARIGRAVDINESLRLPGRRRIYESIGERVMDAIARLKSK